MVSDQAVTHPTLFYTETGVYLFADPSEHWLISEVKERILDESSSKIYQVRLGHSDEHRSFSLRRVELSIIIDEIEQTGKAQSAELIYG